VAQAQLPHTLAVPTKVANFAADAACRLGRLRAVRLGASRRSFSFLASRLRPTIYWAALVELVPHGREKSTKIRPSVVRNDERGKTAQLAACN
jgi:hypothetical protein